MTFSIAARCPSTGSFGIAISSSSPAVAARCAHLRPGIGAVCSQNITDPDLGRLLLDSLESGASAQRALDALVASTPNIEYRQLAIVDERGESATWSGRHCLGTVATARAENVAAAGNLLADASIPTQMILAFEAANTKHIGDRLLKALQVALAAGGEEGAVHSAGLLIVDRVSWPTTDLRVDWSDRPIEQLSALWRLWRPQIDAYVTRALDPASSPSYGVPGDPERR